MINTTQMIRTLMLSMAVAMSLAQTIVAEDVTLAWFPPTKNADGSKLSNLAGYKVYYGLLGKPYTDCVDVGNVTTATLDGFEVGNRYAFAVTTYNTERTESPFSTMGTWFVVSSLESPSRPHISIAISPLVGGGQSLTWHSMAGDIYRINIAPDGTWSSISKPVPPES